MKWMKYCVVACRTVTQNMKKYLSAIHTQGTDISPHFITFAHEAQYHIWHLGWTSSHCQGQCRLLLPMPHLPVTSHCPAVLTAQGVVEFQLSAADPLRLFQDHSYFCLKLFHFTPRSIWSTSLTFLASRARQNAAPVVHSSCLTCRDERNLTHGSRDSINWACLDSCSIW